MNLGAYAAEKKASLFERLIAGLPPDEGSFDETCFAEAKDKGLPQMGATRFEPWHIVFEFIYPASGKPLLFTVQLDSPERIVFLPVPKWVVENIWQGNIDGSFHFESEAITHLAAFREELGERENAKWFEPQPAKRRE